VPRGRGGRAGHCQRWGRGKTLLLLGREKFGGDGSRGRDSVRVCLRRAKKAGGGNVSFIGGKQPGMYQSGSCGGRKETGLSLYLYHPGFEKAGIENGRIGTWHPTEENGASREKRYYSIKRARGGRRKAERSR